MTPLSPASKGELGKKIHVVPQSHIDLAWLWQFDPETIHACCKPTFSLAVENLDKYPEYRFSQSQVPLYSATARAFPEIFAGIRKHVASGRWEIVGGMFVEFEGAQPCGEALVRQCVLGKRYFQNTFGVDVTTAWQEDAWTHPAQLPQIFRKCGMDSFMFKRGAKGEHLFWWQAPDGSRVLAYKPYHRGWKNSWRAWWKYYQYMHRRYGIGHVMIRIGKGDHGGGPFGKDIEKIRGFSRKRGDIAVEFDSFGNYIAAICQEEKEHTLKFPTIAGELGVELAGDLTNCASLKQFNRDCEGLLLSAEKWASLASMVSRHDWPAQALGEAWEKVLFNQFHDIIGGSGIPAVCEDARRDYERAATLVRDAGDSALAALAQQIATDKEGIVVFNALSWERLDVVEVPAAPEQAGTFGLYDSRGAAIPNQLVTGGDSPAQAPRLLFEASAVPSIGYAAFQFGPLPPPEPNPLRAEGTCIENALFRVEVNPHTGCVQRLWDKRRGRDILDGSTKGIQILALEDEGDSEGRFKRKKDADNRPPSVFHEVGGNPKVEVVERGPVRGSIRVTTTFLHSTFTQDIMIYATIPRIDIALAIDWHHQRWMVKVAFPLALPGAVVTSDSQFCAVTRPADGLEYPTQKWVDTYSPSADYGVAVLNNARYGYDATGSTPRLSILRSPTAPAANTEQGRHLLRYSLYPHAGPWHAAGVMLRGHEFNSPLLGRPAMPHAGDLPPRHALVEVQPTQVILEVIKQAYDSNAWIVRAFESTGTPCSATLNFPRPLQRAVETDMLERDLHPLAARASKIGLDFAAWEIKTIKIVLA